MFIQLLIVLQSYTGLYAESAISGYNQIQPAISDSTREYYRVSDNTKQYQNLPEIKPVTFSLNRSIETSA